MNEEVQQIATRMKALREIANISPETLARQLNIPLQAYLGYESGTVDIPVSLLYQVANKFNVDLTDILTGESPRLRTYCLVRKGKGVSVDRRKEYRYQSLAFNFAHKQTEPFLVTVDPEPADAPVALNSHPGQEFNYLLEGSMKVVIGDHEVMLEPGDSLYFDATAPHGMQALGGAPSVFLAIIM